MPFLEIPANYYGLISGIFIIPTGLVFIPLLFCYVQSPYMTNRGWGLVLLSNLAYMTLAGGTAISYSYFPDSGCIFELWSRYLKFACYGFTLLLRAWVFAFKFHHAQSQVNEKVSRVVQLWLRNRWLISPWFLAMVWVVTLLIHIVFPLLISVLAADTLDPDLDTAQCSTPLLGKVINWVLPSLYAVAVILLMFSLHLSNDGYHIRDELRAVAVIWVVGSVLWLVTNVLPNDWRVGYYIPGFFWLQVSFFLSFCVSTIWVWNLCRTHGAWCFVRAPKLQIEMQRNSEAPSPTFQNLLRDEMFRKDFSSYLCLQFCVENLFFWEAVQQFHSCAPQDMKMEAKAIYDKYLAPGSAYEVNIPMTIKKAVDAQIKEGVFSDTMFDDAATQTLKLMELDSYPRYISRPGIKMGVQQQNSTARLMFTL